MKHPWIRLVTVCVIGATVLVMGCGKNVPCDTDPSQIEDARAELQSAQGELDSAAAALKAAEGQKQDLASKINNLPDKAELEDRLEILKKGSGR